MITAEQREIWRLQTEVARLKGVEAELAALKREVDTGRLRDLEAEVQRLRAENQRLQTYISMSTVAINLNNLGSRRTF